MTQQQSISSIKTIIAFICWAKKTPESSSGHSRLTLNHGVSNGLHGSLWSDHGCQNHWNYSEPILGSHPESSQICSNFQWLFCQHRTPQQRVLCKIRIYIEQNFTASQFWGFTEMSQNTAQIQQGPCHPGLSMRSNWQWGPIHQTAHLDPWQQTSEC